MSSDSSDSSDKGGNTISPLSKKVFQISPAIRWCFTLNNYSEDNISSIITNIKTNCKFAIVGEEVGESGTPHLQGYIEFKKKARPKGIFCEGIHWEKAKGNRQVNIDYCSKEDKVVFTLGMCKPIKILTNLYAWQEKIELLYLNEIDDRKVYWFWEDTGNIGKSQFIKYMIVKHQVLFCCGGKYSDIMNLVFNQDMNDCRCVMFDIP
ncbi:MAG TPA: hypothetical protein EYN64_06535, partial [Flavobacteriales bacterium]|nr:hypothetical protein [Flavobacteriales bacterium]